MDWSDEIIECYCEELGSQQQQPLLIVHGFFASSRNWRQIADKLAEHFHVYLLDMRNHGASPHHPQLDYLAMVADVLHFLDRRQLKKVSILGHSMGGKVAMWLALQHPERIDKLIVADIAPISYHHRFDGLINALRTLPLKTLSNRKQAETFLADAIPDLSYRQFLLQNLILTPNGYGWRIDLDIFQQAGPAIAGFPDAEPDRKYAGQCLFLAGADSAFVKPGDVKGLFPKAEIIFIDHAGHWLHVQQPKVFLDHVLRFLQQN